MKAVVLGNQKQYEALIREGYSIRDLKIFCDTPAFFGFLEQQNIPYTPVDEELIREQWGEINAWCCEKALGWSSPSILREYFSEIEMDMAMFLRLSYNLGIIVRNSLFARWILRKEQWDEVIIFEGEDVRPFPYLRGNVILNRILKQECVKANIKALSLRIADESPVHKGSLKGQVKKITARIYSAIMRKKISEKRQGLKDLTFIACGALNHLRPVLLDLLKKDSHVALFDFDFNLAQLRFALKNKITYLTKECLPAVEDGQSPFDWPGWDRFFSQLTRTDYFTYRDMDLGASIYSLVLSRTREYCDLVSSFYSAFKSLESHFPADGLILDEDIAINRSFLAACYKSWGKRIFCTSHGFFPINFSVRPFLRRFALSTTLVNSDYEAELYAERGWNPAMIRVTGVPRYDELAAMIPNPKNARRHGRGVLKILYCASNIRPYTPDRLSYLGIHKYICDVFTKQCLGDLIAYIHDKPIKLVIKPHRIDDFGEWQAFVNSHRTAGQITLVPGKTYFFDLLAESDIMVSGHWSTGIIESLKLGIPTVVQDYSTGAVAYEAYARNPLCKVVGDYSQLAEAMDSIIAGFDDVQRQALINEAVGYEYLLGRNDGLNTSRVVDEILSSTQRDTAEVRSKAVILN